MKSTIKEVKTSISLLNFSSLMAFMFALNFIAFSLNFVFSPDSEGSTIVGALQLIIAPLTAIFVVSSFSQYYQFLMSAPFKIGTVGKQIFIIFELSTFINFAFTIIFAAIAGRRTLMLFQIMDLFYILIIGYFIILIMSNAELKIREKKGFLMIWLLDYLGTIALYVVQQIYLNEFLDSKTFLYSLIGLTALLFLLVLILRKVIEKAATVRIRGANKLKIKHKRTA